MTNKISWAETFSGWDARLRDGLVWFREDGSAKWSHLNARDSKIVLSAYSLDD